MQRYFSLIVIAAILVVGGGWLVMKQSSETAKQARVAALANARRTFVDKARAAANEADNEGYERQIRAAVSSYSDELKKTVYAKEPEAFDPGAYKAEVDAKFASQEIKEAQHKSMLEGYTIVRAAYDTLMGGSWRSMLTAQGKDTRLDLYDFQRTKDDEGQPVLEAKLLFWGIEDATRVTWGPLSIRYWKTEKQKVKEGGQMVEKDVEKVLGKVDGDATPRILMQNPHKYVAEFPSFVSIGFMWFPLMPREATYADIEIAFVAKTASGDRDVALKWEKFKIPDAWKLAEGEAWQADVVEATEDEIAGKEAAPDGEQAEE